MQTALRNFLHRFIAEKLLLEPSQVVWVNQNMPRLKKPFATLRLYSGQVKAMLECRSIEENAFEYMAPTEARLEIQLFDKDGENPADKLEALVFKLKMPAAVDECYTNNVAFFGEEAVQDLTGLMGDKQVFEPRAAIDFSIRYTNVAEDDKHISEVVITGSVDRKQIVLDLKGE